MGDRSEKRSGSSGLESRASNGREVGGAHGRGVRAARGALVAAALVLLVFAAVAAGVGVAGPADADAPAQQAKLTPPASAGDGAFGRAVAVSGDTAVVGSPDEGAGVARVYNRRAGVWSLQATLTASDGAVWDAFGAAVAISGDTVVIGAPAHTTGSGAEAGAAYVFERSVGDWVQRQKLTSTSGSAYDSFGYAVALDGTTALVGTPYRTTSGRAEAGAATVYVRSAGTWSRQADLVANAAAATDWFGTSVAVSGDTALVGADGACEGAAYVFTRSGAAWTRQTKLTPAGGVCGDGFGAAVSLAGDTALVGAPVHDAAALEAAGSAYVYVRTAGVWAQQAELTAPDAAAYDWFGSAVAIADGQAVVGAPSHDPGGLADAGAAYLYSSSEGIWSLTTTLLASDGAASDLFGSAVGFTGTTVLAGAPAHAGAGAAYVYAFGESPVPPSILSFSPHSGPAGADVHINGAGLTGVTSVTFAGVPAAYAVLSDVWLRATVPDGAANGPITVVTPLGMVTTTDDFTVVTPPQPPAIESFTPASGPVGTIVAVTGTGFDGATEVEVDGAAASFAVQSDTALTATVPAGATSGPISVTTPLGTDVSATDFTVEAAPQPPTIDVFTPASGRVGATITVTGARLSGATEVAFNDRPAAFELQSDASLTATVPNGATSGPISVTTPAGSATSATGFTVTAAPTKRPAIARIKPATARRGAKVTITGTGFGARRGTSFVKFGKVKCTKYLSWRANRIVCRVPAKARITKVRVRVTTAGGTSPYKLFRVKR